MIQLLYPSIRDVTNSIYLSVIPISLIDSIIYYLNSVKWTLVKCIFLCESLKYLITPSELISQPIIWWTILPNFLA